MYLSGFSKKRVRFFLIVISIMYSGFYAEATSLKRVKKLAAKCQDGSQNACRKLGKIALSKKEDSLVRNHAARYLRDEKILKRIVQGKGSYYYHLRNAALSNPNLRDQSFLLNVVESLISDDSELLFGAVKNPNLPQLALKKIVLESEWEEVCLNAFEKLTDPQLLANVAKKSLDLKIDWGMKLKIGLNAVNKLTNQSLLLEVAKYAEGEVQKQAIMKLTDQATLEVFAKHNKNEYVRKAAIENTNLTNQVLLADIVLNDKSSRVCRAALLKMTNQELLVGIVEKEEYSSVGYEAVHMIHDRSLLSDIENNHNNPEIQKLAEQIKKIDISIAAAKCLCSESFVQTGEQSPNFLSDLPVLVLWSPDFGPRFAPFLVGSGGPIKAIFCFKEISKDDYVGRILKWPGGELLRSEGIYGKRVFDSRTEEITIDRRTGRELKTRYINNYKNLSLKLEDIKNWIRRYTKN